MTDGSLDSSRRDVVKLGVLTAVGGLLGVSSENIAAASNSPADEVEGACVYCGPLQNGTPAKSAEEGCTYLYVEYTSSGGPGAWWITRRSMSGWELLHLTTQELRLEDSSDGSADEVGIIQEGGTLYAATYE